MHLFFEKGARTVLTQYRTEQPALYERYKVVLASLAEGQIPKRAQYISSMAAHGVYVGIHLGDEHYVFFQVDLEHDLTRIVWAGPATLEY